MEQVKNKRGREDDGVEIVESSFENNTAKKRNVYGISFTKENKEMEEKEAMGVFDFPWLKDGVTSKSDDQCWDFEDNFLSSLEGQDTLFNAGDDFCEEYAYDLCETPESSMAHVQEAKLVEDYGLELEVEDGDCIWSFLLNKPL
ncbi:uncharacterized protein LOC109804508 isoform X2 [Cajanus cajan]|uniref:Uncharacterized protein n=2 Tax=Cajanus cajan TaxID=3821 RepID=A0A151T6W4_CAJCA|nr:uncharacterized protein LOC109804508 isoform X2 [Cajanus cajan]KYP62790.1 hypothetical protein KK1_017341 [Cajanus cajan]